MKVYSFSSGELTELANQIRGAVVQHMVKEELVPNEKALDYLGKHLITIAEKRSVFPWFKKGNKNPLTIYLSTLSYREEDVDDEEQKENAKS